MCGGVQILSRCWLLETIGSSLSVCYSPVVYLTVLQEACTKFVTEWQAKMFEIRVNPSQSIACFDIKYA